MPLRSVILSIKSAFKVHFILSVLFVLIGTTLISATGKIDTLEVTVLEINSSFTENTSYVVNSDSRPNPIKQRLKLHFKKNKKVTAAILAFPFPFGIVGLHRIYLGTQPYVPVAYIGTLGGVFGILPFIDFCVLVLDKDIDRYANNGKVFMWIK